MNFVIKSLFVAFASSQASKLHASTKNKMGADGKPQLEPLRSPKYEGRKLKDESEGKKWIYPMSKSQNITSNVEGKNVKWTWTTQMTPQNTTQLVATYHLNWNEKINGNDVRLCMGYETKNNWDRMNVEWMSFHTTPSKKTAETIRGDSRTRWNNKNEAAKWFCGKSRKHGEVRRGTKETETTVLNTTFTDNTVTVKYSRPLSTPKSSHLMNMVTNQTYLIHFAVGVWDNDGDNNDGKTKRNSKNG